jgi:hypothetical protein
MLSRAFEALLCDLARRFPAGARWALTCGSALTLHGLDYEPSDLDFFGDSDSAERLGRALHGLPIVFPMELRHSAMISSYWGRFRVNGTDVDIVGDFTVDRDRERYAWNAAHPCWDRLEVVKVRGVGIPLFSLEDLLVLYMVLPGEQRKIGRIHDALKARGCDAPYLRRLLGPNLVRQPVVRSLGVRGTLLIR